jgi:hypothetical protein
VRKHFCRFLVRANPTGFAILPDVLGYKSRWFRHWLADEFLQHSNIYPILLYMGSEAVTQDAVVDLFVDPGFFIGVQCLPLGGSVYLSFGGK